MNKEFIKELEQPFPKEVFVDTIKACHPAEEILPVKGTWLWDNKRKYHYIGDIPFLNATAKFIYKKLKDKPYDNVFIEFSVPKVLYDDNTTGFLYKDSSILKYEAKDILTCYNINVDLAANPIYFDVFDVRRIDHSFSFRINGIEEQEEFCRLFQNMYFKYLKPGRSGSKSYDYDIDGYCFTSKKLDIVLYDKAKEQNEAKKQDKAKEDQNKIENTLRLEMRCKEPFSAYDGKVFGSVEKMFRKANNRFAYLLTSRNLIYDFVPENEYEKLITDCYNAKKAEYSANPKGEKPSYLKFKLDHLLANMMQINEEGCHSFHSQKGNRVIYNACLNLAQDAEISILYTKLNYRISFIDNVCRRSDSEYVEEETVATTTEAAEIIEPSEPAVLVKPDEQIKKLDASFVKYNPCSGFTNKATEIINCGCSDYNDKKKARPTYPDYRFSTLKSVIVRPPLYHRRI